MFPTTSQTCLSGHAGFPGNLQLGTFSVPKCGASEEGIEASDPRQMGNEAVGSMQSLRADGGPRSALDIPFWWG